MLAPSTPSPADKKKAHNMATKKSSKPAAKAKDLKPKKNAKGGGGLMLEKKGGN